MHRRTLVIALSAALLAFSLRANESTDAVTRDNAFTFYRSFQRLTKHPHQVSPRMALLCAVPSPQALEAEKRKDGPHLMALVHYYANSLATDTITRKLKVFPADAILVKEKLAAESSATAVGGMIKRDPGYDPQNGDWEYFYSDRKGYFVSGRLQNCAECHANTNATDYVFVVRKPFGL